MPLCVLLFAQFRHLFLFQSDSEEDEPAKKQPPFQVRTLVR